MPYSVLMDCDPGVDDMVAILVAAVSDQINILGITTVNGNVGVDQATVNALSILDLAGQEGIPVARGAGQALIKPGKSSANDAHGNGGLGGALLPPPKSAPDQRHAVDFIADMIETSPTPITLIATGPLTNVAMLFARHPQSASRLERLIIMGGSIGPGNVGGVAEFNIWCDPEAAYRVLSDSGLPHHVPVTIIGLDVAAEVQLAPEDITRIRECGPQGALVADALGGQYLSRFEGILGYPSVPIYDALTVVELLRPGCISFESTFVDVNTTDGPDRGRTTFRFVASDVDGSSHRVGVGARSGEAKELIMDHLTRLSQGQRSSPPERI